MTLRKMAREGALLVVFIGNLLFFGRFAEAEVHNWAVGFTVEATGAVSVLEDMDNFAAVVAGASDGFDNQFDACIDSPPPPVGTGSNYLNLSFYHPEFQDLQSGITGRCSADFHAPFDASGEWEMLLETNLLNAEVVLTWNLEVENAVVPAEYKVLIVDGSTGAQVFLQYPDQPDLEQSDYRVNSGTSVFSRFFLLSVVNDPPPEPEGLEAEAGEESVQLRWDSSNQPADVSSFVIRYGTESGIYPFERVTGDVEQAVIYDLDAETTYYFRLWARDRSGLEGKPSAEEASAQPSQLGDLNSSGSVDYQDLFQISLQWYASEPLLDFTWDGECDQEDLLRFRRNWHRGN